MDIDFDDSRKVAKGLSIGRVKYHEQQESGQRAHSSNRVFILTTVIAQSQNAPKLGKPFLA